MPFVRRRHRPNYLPVQNLPIIGHSSAILPLCVVFAVVAVCPFWGIILSPNIIPHVASTFPLCRRRRRHMPLNHHQRHKLAAATAATALAAAYFECQLGIE